MDAIKNTPLALTPIVRKPQVLAAPGDKDSVELGAGKRDYPAIAASVIGGAGGAFCGYHVGLHGGFALGVLSSTIAPIETVGGLLQWVGASSLIGGAVGAVAGAVCTGMLAKKGLDYLRDKISHGQEKSDPDVARVFNHEDNYDSFRGLDLKIARIGTFTEKPHVTTREEKLKTTDVLPDAEARARQAIKALNHPKFKTDVKSLKLNPEAKALHTITGTEQFKGVALGKKLKFGKAKKVEEDRIKYETDFTFHAELPFGAQAKMTTKMTLKYDSSIEKENQEGFMR